MLVNVDSIYYNRGAHMVMVDPDVMYWMKNHSWWTEDENGEYILTDEATEKARKIFRAFSIL
ncbi:hypothetical protein HMPREF2909_00975 [Alloscardovia sp. HMSC034E08]|nr:hypothetical protein HMPREF2909_00975 [Alloscardovia sp. HMSC034E08]